MTTEFICPDCGQRYDPAKAATVARVRTRDGRAIKPGRVEAQDVSTAGHRNGRHHRAHIEITRRALDGWSLVNQTLFEVAKKHGVQIDTTQVDGPTRLWFVRTEALEGLIVETEDNAPRITAQRIRRATLAVRVDHPWWRAYLHELGASAEHIARGLTINDDNRADVLFERKYPAPPCVHTPTLRGVL